MRPRKLLQDVSNSHHHHHHRHHHNSTKFPVSSPKESNGPLGFEDNTPFDSSMGTATMIILSALFFMGFFSLYLRRCTKSSPSTPPSDTPAETSPRRQPAKPEENSLVSYGGETKDCVICLTELKDGETVRIIPCCGHVFHPMCVDTWLESHASCPLCRSTNVFGGAEEENSTVQIDLEGESTVEI